MITAMDDRDGRMLGLSAGAEDYLSKPVDRAEPYGDYHDRYSRMLEREVGSRAADLVESERRYRSTFDAAPVGIAHVGLDGKWLRVNQRLGDLLGYSPDALRSFSIQELVQPDPDPEEAESLRQMAEGNRERHAIDEKRLRHEDGHFVWVRVNTSIHRDAEGWPQHFITVIEDITERRSLEAKIRQASKMDAIGRLASGVAHDFNNLLTVILGFAELVTADATIPTQHRTDLDEIIKAAERAASLRSSFVAADGGDLDETFCRETVRTVGKDNVVTCGKLSLQISKQPARRTCAGLAVVVKQHLGGGWSIHRGLQVLGRYDEQGRPVETALDAGKRGRRPQLPQAPAAAS